MYATKTQLGRIFGQSMPTVYRRIDGIEKEMKQGRYNRYAICDNLVSVAVYADYEKYHKRLADKNLRKTVPEFSMADAHAYLEGSVERMKKRGKGYVEEYGNNSSGDRVLSCCG